jgi:hypothetical protein
VADIKDVVARQASSLLLDPDNPRLPLDVDAADQDALLRFFDANYNLDELAESMLEKGFFSTEALLTIPSDNNDLRIVVEGNRRLATVKLLVSAEHRAAVDRTEYWNERTEQFGEAAAQLEPLPTFEYETRDELLDYLGFRHVTGVVEWRPEAKARYIVERVHRGQSFIDIARAIGSRQDAVRRQFVAWSALDQAQAAGSNVDNAQRFFGVFYRALQSPGIREYMHLKEPAEATEADTNPVEQGHEARVADVSSWLFGDPANEQPAVITDSRQITNLGLILSNTEAATVLKETRDFQLALDIAGGDRTSIETALTRARTNLVTARGHAFEFVGDRDIIDRAKGVDVVLQKILEILGEPLGENENDAAPAAEP